MKEIKDLDIGLTFPQISELKIKIEDYASIFEGADFSDWLKMAENIISAYEEIIVMQRFGWRFSIDEIEDLKAGDDVKLLEDIVFNYIEGNGKEFSVNVARKGEVHRVSKIDDDGIWLDNDEFYVQSYALERA